MIKNELTFSGRCKERFIS